MRAMKRSYYVKVRIHRKAVLLNTMRILKLNINLETGLVWW